MKKSLKIYSVAANSINNYYFISNEYDITFITNKRYVCNIKMLYILFVTNKTIHRKATNFSIFLKYFKIESLIEFILNLIQLNR